MKKKKMYKRYWHKLPKIRGERDLCIISHVLHHYQIYFSNSPGCCIINDCIAKPSKRSCSVIPWCSASASLDLESTLLHTHEVPIMQWLILIKRTPSLTAVLVYRDYFCFPKYLSRHCTQYKWPDSHSESKQKAPSFSDPGQRSTRAPPWVSQQQTGLLLKFIHNQNKLNIHPDFQREQRSND